MAINDWLRRCAQAVTGCGHYPVADDCAAYLAGSYVAHVEQSGLPVPIPTWAWLNVLAHGGRSDIAAAVSDPDQLLHRMFFGWRECRSVIASELLDVTQHDDRLLRRLQIDVLEPVEARLFRFGEHSAVATAQHVLEAMRSYVAALDNGS